MDDRFVKARALWLEQVFSDPAITPAGFRVAYAISRMFNRNRFKGDSGLIAWDSQNGYAAAARLTRRGVQKCIEALVARGHLSVVPGCGYGRNSTCQAVLLESRDEPEEPTEKANAGSSFEAEKGEQGFVFCNDEKANVGSLKGEPPFRKRRTAIRTNKPLSKTLDKTLDRSTPLPPEGEKSALLPDHEIPPKGSPGKKQKHSRIGEKALGKEFEKFYAVYPKRVERGEAERAYTTAIKAGATHEELLLGAMRYAAERDREPDPATRIKFTKNPARWLRQKCWQDEPAPAPSTTSNYEAARRGQRPAQIDHLATALEGIGRD